MNTKKYLLTVAILFAAVNAIYAQGNGQAGITEATNLITSYFDPGTKLVYAIGAVCGLIGGVKVYNKFSSGDRTLLKRRLRGSEPVSSLLWQLLF